MKIGFFGDGPWAVNALRLLWEDPGISVEFACLRHPAPDPALLELCQQNQIPALSLNNVNEPSALEEIARFACDLHVSIAYDQIIKKELLGLPPQGTINCHCGKLPFYRGRNILNWALINDEKEFGITVHFMDEGVDTGDILLQECFPITDGDTYATLLETAHRECPRMTLQAVRGLMEGSIKPRPQAPIHPTGSYCAKRGPGDEIIDWDQTSREVFNFIRAVCRPGPMARTFCGNREVRINQAEMLPDYPRQKGIPGAVLFADAQSFWVQTRDSAVRVTRWETDRPVRMGDRLQKTTRQGEIS